MAKKKRKKGKRPQRPPTRPTQPQRPAAPAEAGPEEEAPESERRVERPGRRGAAAAAPVSNRQARKEQARRERERRMKRARRRRRAQRIVRWAAILGAVGAIAIAIWYFNTRPVTLEDQAAAETAAELGCGPNGDGAIQEPGAAGAAQHLAQGEPPPDYPSRPAASGRHSATTYQGPPVLQEPVTPELETNLVHNLEHAYVIMYYRDGGDAALPGAVVDRLTEIAERENKVLLAPYPDLPEGISLSLVAWNKLLPCPGIEAGEADDVTTVAEAFIDQYRGTSNAPEPQVP